MTRARWGRCAAAVAVGALLAGCSSPPPRPASSDRTPGAQSAPDTPSALPTSGPVPLVAGVLDPRVPIEPNARAVLGPPPGPKADQRPSRIAAPAQRFALLVGITHYQRPTHDTIGGAGDVRLFRSMLLEAGWLPQNVHVLTDAQATGVALRAQLRWLAAHSRPGTFTLFHYSGHVMQLGGDHEALWPVNSDIVDDAALAAVLGNGRGRMWVDIAGCEADSFAAGLASPRVLFTGSSQTTQKAYEYPPWGRSVWVGLLLDLGTRRRGADADHDGRVSVGEAIRYARYYAQGITLRQTPYGRQTPVVLGDRQLGWTLADPPA